VRGTSTRREAKRTTKEDKSDPRIPDDASPYLTLNRERNEGGGRGRGRSADLRLEALTGASNIFSVETLASLNPGERLDSWSRFEPYPNARRGTPAYRCLFDERAGHGA